MSDEAQTGLVAPDEREGKPSASKFERVASCPGSENLIRLLKLTEAPDKPDEWAERGTRIHRARQTGNTLELSQDEADSYKKGLEYEEKIQQHWLHTFAIEEAEEQQQEFRIWLHDHRLDPIASAMLDVHFITADRKRALIIDWKTAGCSRLTGATANWQLKLQAVCLKQEIPTLENIRVAFCKTEFDPRYIDFCDYGEWELEMCYKDIVYHTWKATQPDAERIAGSQCYYCPAMKAGKCPEALAFAMLPYTMALISTGKHTTPEEMVAAMNNGDDLLKVWQNRNVIERILEAATDRLKATPKELLELMGLFLPEHGARNDKVTELMGAIAFLRENHSMTDEESFQCMDLAWSRTVDWFMKTSGMDDTKAAAKKLREILLPFITEGHKAPSLKRIKGL